MTYRTQDQLVTDNRFAVIPHWVFCSGISSGAVHLYCILRKYADGRTNEAFPARATLARDLGKSSTRTVDKFIEELKSIGALEVIQRKRKGTEQNYTNIYKLKSDNPKVPKSPEVIEVDPVQSVAQGGAVDCAENYTHSTKPTSSSLRSPSISDRRSDSSLRSPSCKARGHELINQVRAIEAAQTEEDYETATTTFLEQFETEIGEDPGFHDYGWAERLTDLVNRHGLDYGTSKWLSQFTNASRRI